MSDEDAFQAALDENPDDHATRLVFADWLEERGDIRAVGYRALGERRLYPQAFNSRTDWRYWATNDRDHYDLPCPRWWRIYWGISPGIACRVSRRTCDDAAAKAFAQLPAERRAELLSREAVAS